MGEPNFAWRRIDNHRQWLRDQHNAVVLVGAANRLTGSLVAFVGRVDGFKSRIFPVATYTGGSCGVEVLVFTHWMPFVPPVDEG
jgi:hypothetical protein